MKGVGEGVPGYVTPKVAVGAVVGNDDGEILLVQRADSGIWLYPTGWADVGYSAAEVAVKEVQEETGIECEVVSAPRRARRPAPRLHPDPALLAGVPLPSARRRARSPPAGVRRRRLVRRGRPSWPLAGYQLWGDFAFAAVRGEPVDTFFDRPRDPPWRG